MAIKQLFYKVEIMKNKIEEIKIEFIKAKLKNFFSKNPKAIAKILSYLIKEKRNV
jgi:hypothetical protein